MRRCVRVPAGATAGAASCKLAVDGALAAFENSPQAKQLDDNFNLAYRLMSSPKARENAPIYSRFSPGAASRFDLGQRWIASVLPPRSMHSKSP